MFNMKNKTIFKGVALLVLVAIAFGCADQFEEPASPSGTTLADVADANAELDIFVAAMNKTNLLSSLDNVNSGDYTAFAPHDSAFVVYFKTLAILNAALYNEDSVLSYIANKMSPTSVLTIASLASRLNYHIVSSKIPSSSITTGNRFTTLNGARLSASKSGSYYFLNANVASGSKIVIVDLAASNGTVHVVNKVMTAVATASVISSLGMTVSYTTNPPGVTVPATDATDTDYDLFAIALRKTGVCLTLLPNASPLPDYTVFAPRDLPFRTYLASKDASVTSEATAANYINSMSGLVLSDLTNLIKYHIVAGRFVSLDLSNGVVFNTLYTGKSFTIDTSSGTALIDVNATNTNPKIAAGNTLTNASVLHGIDGVLRPN